MDNLGEKIKKARQDRNQELSEEQKKDAENMSAGMRAGAELIGSIGGGALIGWLLDQWLGSSPWLLIVFLLLGIVTGFMNVYKITQNMGSTVGFSELHKDKKHAKDSPEKNKNND